MSRVILPVKGIRIPRLFIWLLGILHSRILHTASIDQETKKVSSGYISNKIKLYSSVCKARADQGRKRLEKTWPEAEAAMCEIRGCSILLGSESQEQQTIPSTGVQARALEAKEKTRAAIISKRHDALLQLIALKNTIQDELSKAQNEADATAELLKSVFSSYSHGVLQRPVCEADLPVFPVDDMSARILAVQEKNHNASREECWTAILTFTKEEVKDNESAA